MERLKNIKLKTWMKDTLIILGILLLAYVVFVLIARPVPNHGFFLAPGRYGPMVIANQGGAGNRPGNTLEAFEHATGMGVDVLGLDVRATRDGVVVVIRDAVVETTTDGAGRVIDFTFPEIKTLDAGYNWSTDNGETYPYRGLGIEVPSLSEVFDEYSEFRMRINIMQENPPIGSLVCDLIKFHKLEERVIVTAVSQGALNDFRQACPQVARTSGQTDIILFYVLTAVRLGATYSPTYQAISSSENLLGVPVLNQRFIDTAHNRGLRVHAGTVNEVADMIRLLDKGVDGIVTDYPDRLIFLLQRR